MRYDDQVIYPHPVLRPSASDYTAGEFHDDVEASLPASAEEPLTLILSASLRNTALEELVSDGKAALRVLVNCRETLFSEVRDLEGGKAVIQLDPALVHGSVQLVTVLCATEDIPGFTAESFVDDFRGMEFDIPAGGFLAFCAPRVLYIEREAFGSAESVINLVQSDQQSPGLWSLNTDKDRLEIHVDKDIMRDISLVRGSSIGKACLINSLYSAAIQQAVEVLRTDGGDDMLWKRVFRQRCALVNTNIDDENNHSSEITQIILGLPLGGLLKQLKETDAHAH